MNAVILAGGQGKRMLPLTLEKPKPMVRVNGKPLLAWVLDRAQQAGITQAALIVNFRQDVIRNHFGNAYNGMPLSYIEQHQHLGTGHAIQCAKSWTGKDDFLVVYGDVIPPAKALKKLAAQEGFDCVMVVRKENEPWKYGCMELKGKKVLRVVEKPGNGKRPSDWVNAGLYKFSPKIFTAIKKVHMSERGELEITDAINVLARQGRVACVKTREKIIDVGRPEDVRGAEKRLYRQK